MSVEITLEHDESVFVPTTITKFAITQDSSGRKESPRPWVRYSKYIYYAKNGRRVTAVDVYDRHVHYTQLNADKNDVEIKVIQSDLFENVEEKFDVICCDVSGVDRRVAEISGGSRMGFNSRRKDIMPRNKRRTQISKCGGELYVCATQFSDLKKIKMQWVKTMGV